MIEEILADAEAGMVKAVEHVQNEFGTVRTGRANPSILHRVSVDYYGTATPLQQLASFAVPEPTMLVVTPFDPGALGEIEKAISVSGLGLMPANDGHVIRLAFPPLTEERRKELVKVVHNLAEEGKVSIRNIRRPHKDQLEDLSSEISEDDIRRAEKDLQALTDKYVARIDELFEHKQTELLEV
ncbi:MAG: ribosome recycling factor [Acidimicrobiia bacterium]|nr:ribosome recycling factor [Acidimicrobiia bacterium]